MKNWIACSNFLILFLSLFVLVLYPLQGQSQSQDLSYSLTTPPLSSESFSLTEATLDTTGNGINQNLPDPTSVLYKSMIIPGWGQIVNKQIWKVPIVYGLLGGLGWYSVYTTKNYHDYRAAYYNLNEEADNDFRFGPTPDYISEDANLEQLRDIRNTYRNRRDQIYIGLVLAYGLNIIDAYVFAHMRSFDVSENLSMRPQIKPGIPGQAAPGVTLSLNLYNKNN